MNTRAGLYALLFSVLPAAAASADPFTVLPGRNLVFRAAYTTDGVFECRIAECTGSGTRSVTLGSGANATTLSFTGVSATAAIGNTPTRVPLGAFQSSPTNQMFKFPTHPNPFAPIVWFHFSVAQTSPTSGSDQALWTFGPGGGGNLPLLQTPFSGDHFLLPTGPNPPGFGYSAIVYTYSPFPFTIVGNGTTQLDAQAAAVPEPGTLMLVGSCLALAAARRRRRAANGSSRIDAS